MTWGHWLVIVYLLVNFVGGAARVARDLDRNSEVEGGAVVITAIFLTALYAGLVWLVTTL